jgi:putative transposase
MAAWPEDYRRSSAGANLSLHHDALVTPHPVFSAFVATASRDATPYRDWLHAPIDTTQTEAIRLHIQQERALGDPRFQAMASKALNRPVAVRRRGRPAKIAGKGPT